MKKLSFEEAQKRFLDQGRTDISLCKEEFISWKTTAKFFDLVFGNFFWAPPNRVYKQKSCHPERSIENRKTTNLKKFGNTCSLHGMAIREKVKKTNLEKYGTEHVWQSKIIKTKIRDTNLKKFGVENPSQAESIKEKKRETVLKHYGVEHQMHSPLVKEKVRQTNLEKYGAEYPSKNISVKNKTKETLLREYGVRSPFQLPGVNEKSRASNLKKWGVEYYLCLGKKEVVGTGLCLIDWYEKNLDPENRPSYTHFCNLFKTKDEISLKDICVYTKEWEERKSTLESFTEKLLGKNRFNRSVEGLGKSYRPDFQLSPNLYLNADGLYWHSEKQKDKDYHLKLREAFEKNKGRIFQFREDEIYNKSQIIESMIAAAARGIKDKLFARNTTISPVGQKEAALFLEENHLMGSIRARHIGLYSSSSGELMVILSFKKKNEVCKIERFCSKRNFVVVGGFSKLEKHLETKCIDPEIKEIHSWVDLRYGTGDFLVGRGFNKIKETLGWKWTDGNKTYNRLRCRANMDHRKMSEKQHAEELGWYRIYDAGQRLYIKPLLPRLFSL